MEGKTELQRNAINTARRKELETYQRALDRQWLDSRMADGGMGRCLALIQREAEMERDFQERTDHASIVNKKAEKEINLGTEVAKVQREETCQYQRRHYLREHDPGLRQLMTKLQAGYVCRDQRQQILHNEYRRLQEKAEELRANTVLANALYNDQEAEHRFEADKMANQAEYCREIQKQIVNKQKEKQCQYEDTLIEKKMLDDIMRTIYDEDMRELKQKQELKKKMQSEMVTFAQARLAWREKQKQLAVKEEKAIEAQAQAASDRSASIVAERERKMREKEELNAKICAKILADEAERKEREDIIKSLQEQEYLERNCNDDVASREKTERVKKETKEALTAQMQIKSRQEVDQKQRDLALRRETEEKIRVADDKEREKERLLKEKRKKYSQELRLQIEENAKRRAKDHQLEESRAQAVWDSHKEWDKEVSTEREKIIKEHAPHLLGYLQAGVLKKQDLPTVREGANLHEHLAKLDIESLAVSNRPKRFAKCNQQCRVLRDY